MNALRHHPFKFFCLVALFFASLFFLDGVAENGNSSIMISIAGWYLLVSSGLLISTETFYDYFVERDPKNYAQVHGWVFLAAASIALGVFTGLWPIWFSLTAGGILQAIAAVKERE